MKLKKKNPITAGTRHQINIVKKNLSKTTNIIKHLAYNVHRNVGRSSLTGHITVRARGAGVKRIYKQINTLSSKRLGIVLCTFYNSNTTSFTSLYFDIVKYKFHLMNSITGVYSGSVVACSSKFVDLKLGYRLCMKNIPVGVILSCISTFENKKAIYAKAAGTFCQLIQRTKTNNLIRLPSSEIISITNNSYATIGSISNALNNSCVIGKAGRNRLKGFRSKVRGIAMNPVDHPHGGRTNGGMPSVTPWSKPTKGKPTVKKKRIYKI